MQIITDFLTSWAQQATQQGTSIAFYELLLLEWAGMQCLQLLMNLLYKS